MENFNLSGLGWLAWRIQLSTLEATTDWLGGFSSPAWRFQLTGLKLAAKKRLTTVSCKHLASELEAGDLKAPSYLLSCLIGLATLIHSSTTYCMQSQSQVMVPRVQHFSAFHFIARQSALTALVIN